MRPRLIARPRRSFGLALACGLALAVSTNGTQDAIANGDTRTLTIQHMHTKEVLTITYKRWGTFDSSALEKLNWHLRDWRRDEPKRMNPRLFDLLWEVHRESGSGSPINVVSAYRSPETNAMLRRRSGAVAKFSQHMQGNAVDFYVPGMSMSLVREVAMRMQRGGVGYYPSANTPFVHLDVGSVRSWPRMSRDQLARLFPDGKTVHLPAGGGTMPGYDLAYAEIIARGGSVGGHAGDESEESIGGGGGFFAMLFGGGARRGGGQQVAMAPAGGGGDDAGVRAFQLSGGVESGETAAAAATPRGRAARGRRGAQQETQVASVAAPKPEPFIPVSSPAPVVEAPIAVRPAPVTVPAPPPAAPVDAQKALEQTLEAQKNTRQTFASLPLPPRRPADLAKTLALAAAEANHPLPPRRPGELVQTASAQQDEPAAKTRASEDAVTALNRAAAPPAPASAPALAYATVQHPLPPMRRDGKPAANVPAPPPAKVEAKRDNKPEPTIAVTRTRVQSGSLAALMTAASKGEVVSAFRSGTVTGPAVGKFSNGSAPR